MVEKVDSNNKFELVVEILNRILFIIISQFILFVIYINLKLLIFGELIISSFKSVFDNTINDSDFHLYYFMLFLHAVFVDIPLILKKKNEMKE